MSLRVKRSELKYYINNDNISILRNILKKILRLDSNNQKNKRDYEVTSLYFDTFDNINLDEKLAGTLKRKKFRIRIYNKGSIIKFEEKNRENSVINKQSFLLDKEDAKEIISGNYNIIYDIINTNDCILPIYSELKSKSYRPRVIVQYDREAYTLSHGNTRITIDKNLRTFNNQTDLFNIKNNSYSILNTDIHILEVKYSLFLPSAVRAVLNSIIIQPNSISKFALCQKYIENNQWVDKL